MSKSTSVSQIVSLTVRLPAGMRYALVLVKVALTTLLMQFEVHPAPEQQLPPARDPVSPLLVFQGGVWLRFKPL